MQSTRVKWLASFLAAFIAACTPAIEDEMYGAGFIVVDEKTWTTKYNTPYPFTVPSGEISCGSHPTFGLEVYFNPAGFTDESYVGTPLNRAAENGLKQAELISNVPYGIKKDADLNNVINLGLTVCNDYQDTINTSE